MSIVNYEVPAGIVKLLCTLVENTKLSYTKVATALGLAPSTVYAYVHKMYTPEDIKSRRSSCVVFPVGSKHPMYKGIISDGKGHWLVLKPSWFTGRPKYSHAYVHHIVYCEANGLSELPKGLVIHHIDGDSSNNSIDNLKLLTQSEHISIHRGDLARGRKRATTIPEGSTAQEGGKRQDGQ